MPRHSPNALTLLLEISTPSTKAVNRSTVVGLQSSDQTCASRSNPTPKPDTKEPMTAICMVIIISFRLFHTFPTDGRSNGKGNAPTPKSIAAPKTANRLRSTSKPIHNVKQPNQFAVAGLPTPQLEALFFKCFCAPSRFSVFSPRFSERHQPIKQLQQFR
jgi:hypothetical protein